MQTQCISGNSEGQSHAQMGGVYRASHQEEGKWTEPKVLIIIGRKVGGVYGLVFSGRESRCNLGKVDESLRVGLRWDGKWV